MSDIGTVRTAIHGAVGGMAAGMAMGMTSMMAFPLMGAGGFWQPLNIIASTLHADWASVAGFSPVPVMIGMGLHGMTSMGLGVAFALLARATGRYWLTTSIVGAMAVWAAARFVMLPVVDPAFVGAFPGALFALGHAMFGVVLGGWLTVASSSKSTGTLRPSHA